LPTNRWHRHHRTQERQKIWKSKQSANTSNATLRKSELSLVKSNDTFLNYLIIILAEYQYVRKEGRKYLNVNEAFLKLYGLSSKEEVIEKQELS
jgi:hypothetical protein